MRILIIGAGWYGCHLAKVLLEGGHKIILVDKSNTIFSGSSSKNQNRLHLGFHYPRSTSTITECQSGYSKFIEYYDGLTTNINNNLYFIAKEGSLSSINNLKAVFEHNTCDTFLATKDLIPIVNINNECISVKEKYINPFKAMNYFKCLLLPYLVKIDTPDIFNSIDDIVNYFLPQQFDTIINCTYNHLEPIEFDHYELFCSLVYTIDTPEIFAYTVMDGAFFSIYPYDIEQKLYTVTSVKHGPIYSGKKICAQQICISEFVATVEKELLTFMPNWHTFAKFHSHFTSWKTKPCTNTDDRTMKYMHTGNTLHFYGGKITGIFEAEKILNDYLQNTM